MAASRRAPPRQPATSGWRYTFSSLTNRDFLFLWLGMLAMMSGMQMQLIARNFLVYELTGAARILALVNAAGGLPMLGLALFGGVVADRLQRKLVVQTGQGVAAAIALFVAVSISTDTVTWIHLLVAATLQGAMWAFMMPAREALIPQLVGPARLSNAIALSAAGIGSTALVAPAIAGVLYATIGPEGVYYVIAGLGVLAFTLTGLVPRVARPVGRTRGRMMSDIKAGLVYIRGNQLVLILLVVALATVLLAQPIRFFLPVLVVEAYNKESEAFGVLISVMGLGSLIGSLAIAAAGKGKRGLVLLTGSFVSAIALILVGLVPVYFAALGFMLLLGLGDSTRRALNHSLLLENSAEQYRGRVMSVLMMNFGLMPLGAVPAGFAIDLLGIRAVVGISGGLMIVTTAAVLLTQRRLRTLD